MYNQDIKNRFMWELEISQRKSSAVYSAYAKLFDLSEQIEVDKGRDLAELYRSELAYLDKIVKTQSKIPTSRYKACLLRYFQWYKNRFPAADTGYALSWVLDSLEQFKQGLVSSPTHLQIEMDKIFKPEEGSYIDNVYRCFLWIAFGGVRYKIDADTLESKDIKFEEMCFWLDGYSYPIYPQALKAMRSAVKDPVFMCDNASYRNSQVIPRDRVPGNKVLRGVRADAGSSWIMDGIRLRIAEVAKDDPTVKNFSYRSVFKSGIFYRQYELEMSGMDVDFSGVVKESRHGKDFPKTSLDATRSRDNAQFKDEYYIWKYLMYKDKV